MYGLFVPNILKVFSKYDGIYSYLPQYKTICGNCGYLHVKSRYSIKDLEMLSGIKAHTIRAWEQRHKLITPKRTVTNIRYYGDDDLRVILNASILLEHEWKIGQIAKLTSADIAAEALNAVPYLGKYTFELNELKLSTLNFDIERFESIMAKCISEHGIHDTFQKIIGDYIEELGKLWLSGSVSISQEHFMSSMIRQKLYSAIDNLSSGKGEKTFALFLPANELHEIGLLYLAYVLKERGDRVIYLGQSLPKEYLTDLLDNQEIDALVSVFTTNPDSEYIPEYLDDLAEIINGRSINVHLTGYQFTSVQLNNVQDNIHIYSTLKDLSGAI
jgi:DNA-binding transcriptional MerR regulator